MSKRILSALLAVLFLITGLPSTVWAVGEGNMEAGGGQTETVTGDSFWNGQWGIRFCVVDVVSQSVVGGCLIILFGVEWQAILTPITLSENHLMRL